MPQYLGLDFFAHISSTTHFTSSHVDHQHIHQMVAIHRTDSPSHEAIREDHNRDQRLDELSEDCCGQRVDDCVDNEWEQVVNEELLMTVTETNDKLIPSVSQRQNDGFVLDAKDKPIVNQLSEDLEAINTETNAKNAKRIRFDLNPRMIERHARSEDLVDTSGQPNERIVQTNRSQEVLEFMSFMTPKQSNQSTKWLNPLVTNADKLMDRVLNGNQTTGHTNQWPETRDKNFEAKAKSYLSDGWMAFESKYFNSKVTNKPKNANESVLRMSQITTPKPLKNIDSQCKRRSDPMDLMRTFSVRKQSTPKLATKNHNLTFTPSSVDQMTPITVSCVSGDPSLAYSLRSNESMVHNMNSNERSEASKTESNGREFLNKRVIEWRNNGFLSQSTPFNRSHSKSPIVTSSQIPWPLLSTTSAANNKDIFGLFSNYK